MRMQRTTLALLLGAALSGASFLAASPVSAAAPTVQEGKERLLKDRDLGNLGKKLGEWFTLIEEGEDLLQAEQDFREELEKVNVKKLKGGDLLSSPADLGMAVYLAKNYPKKAPRRVNGKIVVQTENFKDSTVEYAIWTPSKFNPRKGPLPLILSIPEEGMSPKDHLQQKWTDGTFKEGVIIASPKMPGDSKTWDGGEGRKAILLTLRFVTNVWAVDANQVFIGGRGRGGEAALAAAHAFPDRFAGAFAWGSDAGEGLDPENLRHTPVMISGGGARATAFEERAKVAGIESIVLDADAGEPEFIAWFAGKTRVNYPEKISVVPQGRYPYRSHWVQFAPVSDTEGVRVDAEFNRETNTITLTSSGIREVSVFLCDEMVDLSKPVKVIANGVESTNTFPRSITTFMDFLKRGKNDAGRVFVATKQFHLPAIASKDDAEGSGSPK